MLETVTATRHIRLHLRLDDGENPPHQGLRLGDERRLDAFLARHAAGRGVLFHHLADHPERAARFFGTVR
jgi:hypothetical protein